MSTDGQQDPQEQLVEMLEDQFPEPTRNLLRKAREAGREQGRREPPEGRHRRS